MRIGGRDRGLATGIAAAGILALRLWPPALGWADESYYLYEAKRLAAGEVLYREVFEITTPGSLWLMAGLYQVFGTDLAVARAAFAVVHGLLAALLFIACRQVGARRGLAALAAFAHLALCQPVWPYASPHWLGALGVMALLVATLAVTPRRAVRAWGVAGLALGALAAVTQQKAPAFGLALLAVLAFDGLSTPWRETARRLAALAGGCLLVLLPTFAIAVAQAGVAPVWDALVTFPLQHYRGGVSRPRWGGVALLTQDLAPYTILPVLRALPLVGALLLVRLALGVARRDWRGQRALVVLLAFSAASVLSIAYYPDFIHYAFAAGPWWVAAADCLERGLAWGGRAALVRRAGTAAAALAMAGLAWHWHGAWQRAERAAPVRDATAFGEVAFATTDARALHRVVARRLDADPRRRLFAYPGYAAIYLTADAHNPTPFQLLIPTYNPPEHIARALAALRADPVPLIVLTPLISASLQALPGDAVLDYVRAHYVAADDDPSDPPALFVRAAPR